MQHRFPFDCSYGYSLDQLLAVAAPQAPSDFAEFWRARHRRARNQQTFPQLGPSPISRQGFVVHRLSYRSTDDCVIRGWLLEPRHAPARRGYLFGHGYGGLSGPDCPLPDAMGCYLIPCLRGLSLSQLPGVPNTPGGHVIHHIDDRHRYLLGGCIDDLWCGISALLRLRPALSGRLRYLGSSFGGGLGAMALAWDTRIERAYLHVPSFGHQPLRLSLPSVGSAAAVQAWVASAADNRHALDTLRYYDAAVAARFIRQPVLLAAALADPAVAPPGQFAIHNALAAERRQLVVLTGGHFEYPHQAAEDAALAIRLREFFSEDEA